MKKYLTPILALAIVLLLINLSLAVSKTQVFRGYLADGLCGPSRQNGKGNALVSDFMGCTVACMQMPECVAAGYGLETIEGKGAKKISKFYKFDQKGNKLVERVIKNKDKRNRVAVEVIGEKANGLIKVISIKEASVDY